MISEQALSQSERVTNLSGIKHSRTVSPLDGCTFQLAVPRVGQRWLEKKGKVSAVGEVGE